MPEQVVLGKMRRRLPHPVRWVEVELDRRVEVGLTGSNPRGAWLAAAVLALAIVAGAVRTLMTESDSVEMVEQPVWMELPPTALKAPLEPSPDLPRVSTDAAPSPSEQSLGESDPSVQADAEPSFGLESVGEIGSLAVPTGSTLAKEADPVVGTTDQFAGPVLATSVPPSVRPVVPVYPPRAEEMGLEAEVVAVVTTDTSGAVVDLRFEKSGGGQFDQAVRRAVLSTRFVVPRTPDGRGRAVVFRLPYQFHLP